MAAAQRKYLKELDKHLSVGGPAERSAALRHDAAGSAPLYAVAQPTLLPHRRRHCAVIQLIRRVIGFSCSSCLVRCTVYLTMKMPFVQISETNKSNLGLTAWKYSVTVRSPGLSSNYNGASESMLSRCSYFSPTVLDCYSIGPYK